MNYYEKLKAQQDYNNEQEECILNTVKLLKTSVGNINKPGLLFGEIQSGKTRTFIGIIANAFDNGYDISIVLTKSTIALTEQTYKRLDLDFQEFVDDGYLTIYDIMKLPLKIAGKVLNNKLIIVVKKQKHNLLRLEQLFEKYEKLNNKKILIIDDEADFASVGFKKDSTKDDGVTVNVIMSMLNNLKKRLNEFSFLQVTATPYCLYLQPNENQTINGNVYFPNRPEITSIVPTHSKYIGGKYYFEESENEDSPSSNMFQEVSEKEIKILNKNKGRLNSTELASLIVFKQSLINYLIAGTIRNIQEETQDKRYKSSCLIHIDKKIDQMNLQSELTFDLINEITEALKNNSNKFETEIDFAIEQFSVSICKTEYYLPSRDEIYTSLNRILLDEDISITVVNSENEVLNLLDRKGQLRLDTKLNIFIGGDVLDRGITIENMISFFYGRNPKTFQQDTVLQHSRMYGARKLEDLAVTRLYTTARIYIAMKKMYEFDQELKSSFLKGKNNDGVIFVNYDPTGAIKPCNLSKILITSTQTIKSNKRFLPIGFDIKNKRTSEECYQEIIKILEDKGCTKGQNKIIELSMFEFTQIMFYCNKSYDYSQNLSYKWDITSFLAIAKQTSENGIIKCAVKWNRKVGRLKNKGYSFQDSPEDGNKDLPEAQSIAINNPSLILLHQLGLKENNWNGEHEFFWPVMVTPKSTKSAIFAPEEN
ncbi:MAG: DEAD/DEAH box helicase family protein [Chitinophagaceae bacterium]|nr:DEAD/DEAH box helicase family protein [Chitinophagaceae bacterium]